MTMLRISLVTTFACFVLPLVGQTRDAVAGVAAEAPGTFADYREAVSRAILPGVPQSPVGIRWEVDFEELKLGAFSAAQRSTWETTAYVLQMAQMPPRGVPRPPQTKISATLAVLTRELAGAEALLSRICPR